MPKKSDRNILTRRDLFEFLQEQMQTAYRELYDKKRLEYESTLIKTYLLEVDTKRVTFPQNTAFDLILKELFTIKRHKESSKPVVNETNEKGFFEIKYKSVFNKEITFYLDSSTDERFWIIYSLSDSKHLDDIVEYCSSKRTDIDRVWLWDKFLETIQKKGHPRGFGLDYDYRKFEPDEEETVYLKMQLWGGKDTEELYRLLKSAENFRDKIVLSKVRFKKFDTHEVFALEDIKYNSKFTTRGTSFDVHQSIVTDIRQNYREKLEKIENTYALKWITKDNNGLQIEGYPLHFLPVDATFRIDTSLFCEKVFDGKMPFRLWGIVEDLNKWGKSIEAVDLHTGGKLTFEVYPDIISIYLPEGTCGNTVVRFFTNLQHKFSSLFEVKADDGTDIF